MYLTTRRARITSMGAMEWALEITAAVNAAGGGGTELWTTVMSPSYGELSWTTWQEDLADHEARLDKVTADPGYQALAAKAPEFLLPGSVADACWHLLHGEPDPSTPATYVSGVSAVCAGGNIVRAMACGVEIAERATAITGRQTMFARNLTGAYGEIGWLTGHADIGELQAAQEALAADGSWAEFLDTTAGAFVEDAAVTQSTFYRKVV